MSSSAVSYICHTGEPNNSLGAACMTISLSANLW